jgi:hypothetical protein
MLLCGSGSVAFHLLKRFESQFLVRVCQIIMIAFRRQGLRERLVDVAEVNSWQCGLCWRLFRLFFDSA